jgi:antitoxin component of MazEF toxin-antitoxin module
VATKKTKAVISLPSGGGIKWSAPVLIRKEGAGLAVSVPDPVIAALALTAGDVLNFTELPGGSIEVWRVPKSTYASLDAMAAPASKPTAKPTTKAQAKAKKNGRRQ